MKNISWHLLVPLAFLAALAAGCDKAKSPNSEPSAVKVDAVADLKAKAESGDPLAQLQLGRRYRAGDGVEQDVWQAKDWLRKAAAAGNVDSMLEIAKLSANDKRERDHWIRSAAEAGNAEGEFDEARKFLSLDDGVITISGKAEEQDDNFKASLQWLEKSAAQKYAIAQYYLGMIYLLGYADATGSTADKGKAIAATTHAAVEPDMPKALGLLNDSANLGYWAAQKALAILYQEGFRDVSPNPELSNSWWSKLKAGKTPEEQFKIGYSYLRSLPERYKDGKNKYDGKRLTFEQTNAVARQWFENADAAGLVEATYMLGLEYRDEKGIDNHDRLAIQYLKKAADKNYPQAEIELGVAYLNGVGVAKDYAQAYELMRRAVTQKRNDAVIGRAQLLLGSMNAFGFGTTQDKVLAYAWTNLAAGAGVDGSKEGLSMFEVGMSKEEIAEAQKLSHDWSPGNFIERKTGKAAAGQDDSPDDGKLKARSSGTGFAISSSGTFLTANHVANGCKEIHMPALDKQARLVVADAANDLAVLKLDGWSGEAADIYGGDDVRQGEDIVLFGYPMTGFLPASGNITQGIVSALAGPGNNASVMQITAPVQPGNSGGPVLNLKGQVVGVVVAQADAIYFAKAMGSVPQNVNFAISRRTVESFLDGNRIEYNHASGFMSFHKSTADLADAARKFSVKIECWK